MCLCSSEIDLILKVQHLHVPQKDNVTTDRESRFMRDREVCMLNPLIMENVHLLLGSVNRDQFASRVQTQILRCFSYIAPNPNGSSNIHNYPDRLEIMVNANPQGA